MAIQIDFATPDDIPVIIDFVKTTRAEMFPFLEPVSHEEMAERETAKFQDTYLQHPDGAFLTARSDGRLIATIGFVAYDGRFKQFDFQKDRVVEVVRLAVDPAWRRAGLASRLFSALEQKARDEGINRLYLHTHTFLPGAISFWERQGFKLLQIEDDPLWHTTHMSLMLTA